MTGENLHIDSPRCKRTMTNNLRNKYTNGTKNRLFSIIAVLLLASLCITNTNFWNIFCHPSSILRELKICWYLVNISYLLSCTYCKQMHCLFKQTFWVFHAENLTKSGAINFLRFSKTAFESAMLFFLHPLWPTKPTL